VSVKIFQALNFNIKYHKSLQNFAIFFSRCLICEKKNLTTIRKYAIRYNVGLRAYGLCDEWQSENQAITILNDNTTESRGGIPLIGNSMWKLSFELRRLVENMLNLLCIPRPNSLSFSIWANIGTDFQYLISNINVTSHFTSSTHVSGKKLHFEHFTHYTSFA